MRSAGDAHRPAGRGRVLNQHHAADERALGHQSVTLFNRYLNAYKIESIDGVKITKGVVDQADEAGPVTKLPKRVAYWTSEQCIKTAKSRQDRRRPGTPLLLFAGKHATGSARGGVKR